MPDINITVAHKVAVSDTQSIVCDNSDYTVHWTLDEDWSAYDTKTMRAIYMDGTFTDKVFSGAEVELPVCTVPGVVQIGLFAGDIRTSRVAIMRALPSVRSAAGAPADPTPDVYDQLMARINDLGDVSAVVQSGYNDVVAAISNMFGETETVLCSVTPDDFDENRMCLIPSEEPFMFSVNSYVKAQIETESTSSEIRLNSQNIAPGKFAFFCNQFDLLVGAKPKPESPDVLDYAGFFVGCQPEMDMSKMTRLTFVKVDVKKIPIEYVDTSDIEDTVYSIVDEVARL